MAELFSLLARAELTLGALLLAAVIAWQRGRRWLALALLLVLPLTAAEIAGKYVVPTPRVAGETAERGDERFLPELPDLHRPILRAPHYYPSGHTARLTFLVGLGLVVAGRRRHPAVMAVAVALVGLGALTRVSDGSHLPSEVAGGLLLGLAFLGPAAALIARDRREQAARCSGGRAAALAPVAGVERAE